MSENQNDQQVQKNQSDNQISESQNNQKTIVKPADKTTENTSVKEDEKNKPMPAEDSKEQEPRKHPHETSVPVGSSNKGGASL